MADPDFNDQPIAIRIVNIADTPVGSGSEWGQITGTLSNQTDLQSALDLKENAADLAAVAESGDYNDLINTPVGGSVNWGDIIGTLSDQTDLQDALDDKAATTYVDSQDTANLATAESYTDTAAALLVPKTTTVNGHALSANITVTNSDLGAVPTTTTVNGHALSSNVTVTNADLGAVPTTTTVNGHALSSNVTVSASDVGLGSVDNTADAAKNVLTATKWMTARSLAGNSVDGSANVAFPNKFLVQGTSDAGLTGAQFMGSLGTGLVKNTTTTGVQSIVTMATGIETFLGTPSSSNLKAAITDETGSGALVFASTPTLVTPVLGAATATSVDFGGGALSSYVPRTSFSPLLTFGGGSTGLTYTVDRGFYSRVGDMVFILVHIVLSAKGSSTGTANIALPINSATLTNNPPTILGSVAWSSLNTSWVYIRPVISSNTSALFLSGSTAAASSSSTNLADTDFTNTSTISFSGVYFVA